MKQTERNGRADRRDFALQQRVCAYIAERDLLSAGNALLLLLSGGADSMAMLDLLRTADRRLGLGLTFEALHVDYARRGQDSVRDREIVVAACEHWHVPVHVVESGPAPPGQNFQAWARKVRYEAAAQLLAAHELDVIAAAHNRDDQAETVLYRLTKYGGPAGLAGMPAREGRLVRPLLGLGAAEVRAFCRRRGIVYGEDVSNAQPVYARNRLRLHVLPELALINPRVSETLAATADIAACEAEVIAAVVDRAWESMVSQSPAAGTVVDVRRLSSEPPAVRTLCVRRLLTQALGAEAIVERRLVAAVEHLAGSVAGSATVTLPGGWEAAREYERLCVRRRREEHECRPLAIEPSGGWQEGLALTVTFCGHRFALALAASANLGTGGCGGSSRWRGQSDVIIGLSRLPQRVWLRHPRPGEHFVPYGAAQPRSLARLLVAAKVPRDARTDAVVVEIDGEIAWLGAGFGSEPMSGMALAEAAAECPPKQGSLPGGRVSQ
jgi:tRNA(Ile)-lysidine synthase